MRELPLLVIIVNAVRRAAPSTAAILLAAVLSGCNTSTTETSFGVSDLSFHCVDETCEVVFIVDNGLPDDVSVEYVARLSNAHEEVVLEFDGVLELPALQKTRFSRTVVVTDEPARLEVSVGNLQGI